MRPLVACTVATGLLLGVLFAQEGGDGPKKKGKGEDETAKMWKIIEKSYKKPETEREKVIKELLKLAPPDAPLSDDFDRWFQILSEGGPVWDRQQITRMGLAEVFDRMAERLDNASGRIARAEFLNYARRFWREGDSVLWKETKEVDPSAEAEKLFRHLDRDGDNLLTGAEMPEALRTELARWDRSGDGAISVDEYRGYFTQRLTRLHKEYERETRPDPAPPFPPDDEKRPDVFRAGRLPAGLPDWFMVLDRDRDGQVSLFEWRRHGWPLDEFAPLDSNDDGLLEPAELLRLLRVEDKDGARPFAYLMEKRADPGRETPVARAGKDGKGKGEGGKGKKKRWTLEK